MFYNLAKSNEAREFEEHISLQLFNREMQGWTQLIN